MIRRTGGWLAAVIAIVLTGVGPAWAQTPAPAPAAPAAPEAAPPPPPPPPLAAPEAEKLTEQRTGTKPKTLWDEFKLSSYVEMGATFNLNGGQ